MHEELPQDSGQDIFSAAGIFYFTGAYYDAVRSGRRRGGGGGHSVRHERLSGPKGLSDLAAAQSVGNRRHTRLLF